jgi:hypothetical protein
MDTFAFMYRQGHQLIFDIYESNSNIKGLPSIIIYTDNNFHVKIPYLFREIMYTKSSSELKFDTDFMFVMRHDLYDKPERDRNLQIICNDLNRFNYIDLTPKTNI